MNWIYSSRETLCCPLLDRVASSRLVYLCLIPTLSKSNPMTWSPPPKKIHHYPQRSRMRPHGRDFWLLSQLDAEVTWIPRCCLCFADLASSLAQHTSGWIAGTKGGGEFPGIQGVFPVLLGQSMILCLRDEMIEFFFVRASFCPRFWGSQGCLHPTPTPAAGTHMQMWVAAGTHAGVVGAQQTQQPMEAGTQQTWGTSFSPPWTQSKY